MTRRAEDLETNHDLYSFIAELCLRYESTSRSLEAYLRTLRRLAARCRERRALPVAMFAELLADAFAQEPEPFDPRWCDYDGPQAESEEGYDRWEATIRSQIVDLREMDATGMLANELRYFGITAPRGTLWFNFDPCTYLECAAAGTFGWREGAHTARILVPGPVAVLDGHGKLTPMDPRDIKEPTFKILEVGWDLFTDFLQAGRRYE